MSEWWVRHRSHDARAGQSAVLGPFPSFLDATAAAEARGWHESEISTWGQAPVPAPEATP